MKRGHKGWVLVLGALGAAIGPLLWRAWTIGSHDEKSVLHFQLNSVPRPSWNPLAKSSTQFLRNDPENKPKNTPENRDDAITSIAVSESGHQLKFSSEVIGEKISTRKYQDYYFEPHTRQWIEVVGSMVMIHRSNDRSSVSDKRAIWIGGFGRPISVSEVDRVSARALLEGGGIRSDRPQIQLKVLPDLARKSAHLVYWIDYPERLLILDAESGRLINNISKHRTIAPLPKITVYSAQGQGVHTSRYGDEVEERRLPRRLREACQVISDRKDALGHPIVINPGRCTLTVEDSASLPGADEDSGRALDNSKIVAQYYWQKHRRRSFDDKGTELVSVVHTGDAYDNAYWDEEKQFMAYGDGDGTVSGSYTKALDIVGHEMTHGVTAMTAKLIASGEPGALNEAYSDFFGILISNQVENTPDWTVGKEIIDGRNGREPGMRSLAQPGKFHTDVFADPEMQNSVEVPYPSRMSQKLAVGQECNDKNDQCEVHGNSTIPGHAAYLVAKALEDSAAPPASRYDQAGKLYYAVLTQWLTANDGFETSARDTVNACHHLYDAQACARVEHAFEVTEIIR